MIKIVPVICALLVLFAIPAFPQGGGQENGLPLIRNYFPEDFNSVPGCYSLLQSPQGLIYVANESGVLEYDGTSWRLIDVPIGQNVQALVQSREGLIYTGGLKNLGCLLPAPDGSLQFHSLAEQLPAGQRNFGFFREGVAAGDTVYLRGGKLLVQLLGQKVLNTWPVEGWRGLFALNGRVYVHQIQPGNGLGILEDGQIKPIPGGGRFANTHVYVMAPLGKDILIGTMDQGLFRYRPYISGPAAFSPFLSEATPYLLEHQCYSGMQLPDGNFALGTFTGGLALIDSTGRLLDTLQDFSGMRIRVVEGMMADRQEALWLTSENGISRLETHLPISFWGKESGLNSRLADICRFEGQLFFASYNELLTFRPDEAGRASFQLFGRLGKVINPVRLLPLQAGDGRNRLMVGGSSGLAEISRGPGGQWNITYIDYQQNSEYLYHFPAYPRRLYVLNRVNNEIRSLLLQPGGQWQEDSRQALESPSYLAADEQGQLWAGTYHHGLARLSTDEYGKLLPRPAHYFTQADGLPSNDFIAPLMLSGELYVQTDEGVVKLGPQGKEFLPAPELSQWISRLEVQYLIPDGRGNLQLIRKTGNRYRIHGMAFPIVPGLPPQEGFSVDTSFIKRLPAVISSVYAEEKSVLWLGTNKGLYRYHRGQPAHTSYPLSACIRSVSAGEDSLLFTGILAGGEAPFQLNEPLSFHDNALTFHYAAQGYDAPQKNQYRYLLEGFDNAWSNWTAATHKEYTNLPEGNYHFRLQARDLYGNLSPEAGFAFAINPPAWRSPLAYLAYVLLALLGLWALLRYRSRLDRRKLAEQRAKLERERQLNERLRQVDRLKDQFLANTSHELRTPLNGIIGLSESLLEREGDADKAEDLQMVISSGKRLSSLVNDILDFSKLKNAEIQLQPRAVDMHALVDIILRIHAPLAKGKDLSLENRVPLRGSIVHGDENRLMQVMHNLIGNAVKFTESGRIEVGARRKDDELEVWVEDTGTGIPEDKKDAVFQAFEQADGSTRRVFAGTGLGLSISKRLVEMHSGRMWIESELGKGTTFYFTLPLSRHKAAPDLARPEAVFRPEGIGRSEEAVRRAGPPPLLSASEKDEEKIRILVVDDEPINQRVLMNHLRNENFQLVQAMNGSEALRALKTEGPFDLVLLDIMMPRMSGFELCQKIRERYLPSEVPVIMVTAKNQVSDLVEGLSVGANDYLAKPFTKEEFLARIKTHLYLHRINRATGKFVPYEFLKSLGRETITDVRLGDQAQREVTVFFGDIRGYTSMAETMSPEDNFRFVNAINGRLGPHIQDHHGFINQYLGDAIMAIFPQAPEDALKAAIDMQHSLQEYNRYRNSKGRETVRLGMGIHTGPLIMGIIGDRKRMDAATIADTVNAASRVESLTKYYNANILLTEDSLGRIPHADKYLIRYLGKVQVVGKKKNLGLYECFNGDEPPLREHKKRSLQEFGKAIDAYLRQDFADAAAGFEAILSACPEDGAARFLLELARRTAAEGVPEHWSGVLEMRDK